MLRYFVIDCNVISVNVKNVVYTCVNGEVTHLKQKYQNGF